MRFAVCGIGVLLALRADEIKTSLWVWLMSVIAVSFRPTSQTTRETEAQEVSSSGCDAIHLGLQSPLTKHQFG
jgi:hypothetical protein